MNSVHEIIEKIHNEWEIEPKKAIHRGMECPFPLHCSLNLKSKIYPQIPQVLLPKALKDFYTVSNGADLFKVMCAELAGDFHLGDSRQLTDKSLLPFDLVS